MRKLAAILLFLASATAFAAPSGQDICEGQQNGKSISLVLGTYAETGDATLKVQDPTRVKSYDLQVDTDDNMVFTGKIGDGSITIIRLIKGDLNVAVLRVESSDLNIKGTFLKCRVLNFHPDPMAN